MKLRVLDVMNDALGLVNKSDLGGATALIRKALSGEAPADESGDPKARPPRPSAKVIPLPPRRPLGETLRALAAPADHFRPARPKRPSPSRRRISANDSSGARIAGPRARSTTGSMSRPITSGGSWRWCSCCMAARRTRKISRLARR